MWKLFLDDERELSYIGAEGPEWCVARSVDEAMALIEEKGVPSHIAFDHDLALNSYGHTETAMDFLRLLEWEYANSTPELFTWSVHSSNPLAKHQIDSFINSWQRSIEMGDHDE